MDYQITATYEPTYIDHLMHHRKIDILMRWAQEEGMDAETGATLIKDNHRKSKGYILTQLVKYHDVDSMERVDDEYIDYILGHIGMHYNGRGLVKGKQDTYDYNITPPKVRRKSVWTHYYSLGHLVLWFIGACFLAQFFV